MKIGVFDSGIGGMTVLKQIIHDFPNHQYYYLGDTANVPYGSKSQQKIRSLCAENAEILKNQNLDLVVIACNTASALGLDIFKETLHPTQVIGVVEPGVEIVEKEFLKLPYEMSRRILILGTRATAQSGIYSRELRKRIQFNEISEQACPLVVPIIEEGWSLTSICSQVIFEYVKSYLNDPLPGVALLACTHYPWAQNIFEQQLMGWKVINSAQAVSEYLKHNNFIQDRSDEKFEITWNFTDPKAVTEVALNDFRESFGIVINI